ncbi:MAG: hypothetical protein RLZZ301_70 [Bacteroidota bacterium]|jgi:ribosomal protein S18 acetylase RimI-like enzyme
MIPATASDKARVVSIFQEAFFENPHVRFLLGKRFLTWRLRIMAHYVFFIGMRRNGIFLAEDNEGVLVFFPTKALQHNFLEATYQIGMALVAFNMWRILEISQTENRVKQLRKSDGNDIYVWFYGVSKKGLSQQTARSLMRSLFAYSAKNQVAIVAETSLARNKGIYERYGFETYQTHQFTDFPVFFMRREHTCKV